MVKALPNSSAPDPTGVPAVQPDRLGAVAQLLPKEMDLGVFLSDYYQKRPVLVRAGTPNRYDDFLRLEDLDAVLGRACVNGTDFDFFAGPEMTDKSAFLGKGNQLRLGRLLDLYASKTSGTVHLSNLQRYIPAVGRLVAELSTLLGAWTEADLWLTGMNSHPDFRHYDSHDIFTLHIHGRKRWRIFNGPRLEYSPDRSGRNLSDAELGDLIYDEVVEPGDFIYMPPCTPHIVTPVTHDCLHIGVGVHPPTWKRLAERAIDLAARRAAPLNWYVAGTDPNPESVRQELAALLVDAVRAMSDDDIADARQEDIVERMMPVQTPYFASVARAANAQVGAATHLRKRVGMSVRLLQRGDEVGIDFPGGNGFFAPGRAEPALRYIAKAETFTPRDLPGSIDEPAKVLLAHELFKRGLLELLPA